MNNSQISNTQTKNKKSEKESLNKISSSVLSNNAKSENKAKELSNIIANFKHKKLELNNIPYSDKDETTISFKNDLSSNNINCQTINVSSSNILDNYNKKCNLKLKSYMKNTVTDPNTSCKNINNNNVYNIINTTTNQNEVKDINNNSISNSANLNFYVNKSLAASNQYLLSLPNNINANNGKRNLFNSSTATITNIFDNNNNNNFKNVINSNLNKFKNSAVSIKPFIEKSKINKNNRCNLTGNSNYNSNNNKLKVNNSNKQIAKMLLNFSNNSINKNINNNYYNVDNNKNYNTNSLKNNFTGSGKLLITTNNTSLMKNYSNNLDYNNKNISNKNLNNKINNKNTNDSSSLMISSIFSNSKNKTALNFLDESKLQTQSNVSYSFKSNEVIKIKPIKPANLDGANKEIDRKIDSIIFNNIDNIKSQLDKMLNFVKEFEKETDFVKKNSKL